MTEQELRSTQYAIWIQDYELRSAERVWPQSDSLASRISTGVKGMCYSATLEMTSAFPELRRTRGWYGHFEHWWCVAPSGEIIDPTKAQFASQTEEYRPFVEGVDPEPVGKCLWCGSYVWTREHGTDACSAECLEDLKREYASYGH